MKNINWIKLSAINLLFVIMIVLPFLPGPPNKLVIGLSVFGQSAGFFGLLLAPIGIIWAIIEIRKLKTGNNESLNWRPSYYLAIIATVIITAIYLLLVLGVFVSAGLPAGFLGLIPGAFALKGAIKEIRKLRNSSDRKLNTVPFYLLTIPLIAFMTQIYIMAPASDYSRNYAIKKSKALIAAIENYKNKEGQYPESVQDLEGRYIMKIPGPSVMGILNFRYNKINDHYSISFNQWLDLGSLEEIVLYDKNNLRNNLTGKFAEYDYEFDLCRTKGAFAVHDTRHNHWRYYLVD
jgi:hypothetical protein